MIVPKVVEKSFARLRAGDGVAAVARDAPALLRHTLGLRVRLQNPKVVESSAARETLLTRLTHTSRDSLLSLWQALDVLLRQLVEDRTTERW